MSVDLCGVCRGARWTVETASGTMPFHPPATGVGRPCVFCNRGPEHVGWNLCCLDCVDWTEFAARNPDDDDVILAAMAAELGGTVAERADHIRRRLRAHLIDVLNIPEVLPLDQWDTTVDTLHAPYGFCVPRDRKVAFCPELMAEVTRDLSDDDLEAYLDAVEFEIDFHGGHPELEPDEAAEVCDRTMAEVALGSLQLLNATHMAWLNRGA